MEPAQQTERRMTGTDGPGARVLPLTVPAPRRAGDRERFSGPFPRSVDEVLAIRLGLQRRAGAFRAQRRRIGAQPGGPGQGVRFDEARWLEQQAADAAWQHE